LLQRGGKRPQEQRRVLLLFGGEGVPERDARAVFGFPQKREFPREQTVWSLLRLYLKYAEYLRKLVFWLQRYSIHAEPHMGVLLCGKSSS
jgi:hypothetical protein